MRTIRAALTALALAVAALALAPDPADATPTTPEIVNAPLTPAGVNRAFAVPPGYWYLAPYTWLDFTYGACHAKFQHGTFGTISYANMTVLNGGCSSLSTVRVATWGDTSNYCSFLTIGALDCWAGTNAQGERFAQATADGPLIWSYWKIDPADQPDLTLLFWPFP